ncbi:hypothetical protein LTR35_009251 [Friedmanniomyces endolithicus]|uniref:Uncharacterized protein n=1 Tax=Friedmanniomyces endolithicus TaxID=329885 RepID=A0AAN6FMZ0_9PEZI|nr:hypothetical protein LTR35_009251 [Friedmanniomyces endolithicus]KAK0292311.1 hypothetical protein LTS00_008146 [Friedmanniomyces endolithicus]KAK0320307.1 hypothetical protein LTR82_008824 [Friedmanniomyces endolithicus]KAK0993685.1 hypothetical protein LTR54_010977 [Friedmanniomyces endolithicus]
MAPSKKPKTKKAKGATTKSKSIAISPSTKLAAVPKPKKAKSTTIKNKKSAVKASVKPAASPKPAKSTRRGKSEGKPSKSTVSSVQEKETCGTDLNQSTSPIPTPKSANDGTEEPDHWCGTAQIEHDHLPAEQKVADMYRLWAEAELKYAEAAEVLLEVIARSDLEVLRAGKLDALETLLENASANANKEGRPDVLYAALPPLQAAWKATQRGLYRRKHFLPEPHQQSQPRHLLPFAGCVSLTSHGSSDQVCEEASCSGQQEQAYQGQKGKKKASKPKAKKGGRSKAARATKTKEPSVKTTSANKPKRTTIAEKTRAAKLQYGGQIRPWVMSRMQTRPGMVLKDPVEMAKWVEWRKSVVLENVAFKVSTGKIDEPATLDLLAKRQE